MYLCPLETYGEPLCLSSIPFWKRLVKSRISALPGLQLGGNGDQTEMTLKETHGVNPKQALFP
jgi:hypothetical protein